VKNASQPEIAADKSSGRAAGHVEGYAILYADVVTDRTKKALDETARRRQVPLAYNQRDNIEPKSIIRPIDMSLLAVAV
jgi:excinuclease ABC subunit B